MKKLISLVFFVLAAGMGIVLSENINRPIIDSANNAYNKALYNRAIELYNQVLSNGYESSELYYNMGNAYFKSNDIANAVYNYEKALKLDPANDDIKHNLKVAYNRTSDKIEDIPEIFYLRWWSGLKNIMSANSWAIWCIVSSFVLFSMIGIFLLANVKRLKIIGFWGTIFMIFVLSISISIAASQASNLIDSNKGIIFDNTIVIKSAPDNNATDLFVLHEGTKIYIEDEVGEWFKIKIGNGSTGWLPKSSIKII